MARKKDVKIILDTYGNYLGMEKGCIVLRDKQRNETRYPLIENTVSEIVLNSGNMVSTGLLCSMAFWGTDVLISTRNGRPIGVLKDLDDDFHVETRVSQYRALKNGKGCYLAKKFVEGKMKGQNSLLEKYGLETDYSYIKKVKASKETKLYLLRRKLIGLEGKFGARAPV
jgi:CRISPR/Cas system-associated endonuclease Cas1